MPERDGYIPGVPCWVDTSQPDPEAAVAFYGGVFGWELEDVMPADAENRYFMARIRGKNVAAIGSSPPGAPPMAVWNTYVAVADADETAAKAREAGGTVMMEPFDVMDAGRMAVIADPQGAFFELWQPNQHIGANLVNGHGLLSWNELHTTDLEGATSFYTTLFGWTTSDMDMGGASYRVIGVGDHGNGGLTDMMPPSAPPHWLVYFGTDDLEGSVAKIGELGGTIAQPPMDIGEGNRIAVGQDPQGGYFALYAGRFDD